MPMRKFVPPPIKQEISSAARLSFSFRLDGIGWMAAP